MFLKSLTLRGFKSFADKTVLALEPGITVIVGPNGSGKSNIVDALSWVLGTHSPKTLRGSAMADVIYAGAPGRPGLGRAAVEITIDNTAGTLPIEFSEVTLSRSMFATGETTYSINDVECRALDVQELLSDTGLGRQTHTIVGQGQLDAILNAKPEERRLFIEEAAGILKHRRRKERALRKLAQMETHVERLTDLLRELRRSLRPLERQAETAAKAAELQAALREVRVERALRELAAITAHVADDDAARALSQGRVAELTERVEGSRAREGVIEGRVAELAPLARGATETHFRLANLTERFRGLSERIEERRRGLVEAVEEPIAGRDPGQLRAHARAERDALATMEEQHATARRGLEAAQEARREAERARRAHQQAAAAEARRRTEERERRLRWEGEVTALRSALAQAASEEGRLQSQVSGQVTRRTELVADIASVQMEIQRLDGRAGPLGERVGAAQALVERRQQAADDTVRQERELERHRASLEARADTLRAAAQDPGEGVSAVLEAAEAGALDGVLGRLADHLGTPNGEAAALSAALGVLEDALVVADPGSAEAAVALLRARGSSRVHLLAVTGPGAGAPGAVTGPGAGAPEPGLEAVDASDHEPSAAPAPDGSRLLADVLDADSSVRGTLRRALGDTYLVEDFATACELADLHPELVFVSLDGEVAGARGYAGGRASPQAPVLALSAAADATKQAERVGADLLVAHRKVGDADRALAAARQELEAATAAMQESDALITGAAERLRRLRKELAVCETQLSRLDGQRADLAREIGERRRRLQDLEDLDLRVRDPEPEGPDLEAERLEDVLASTREHEVQARIAVTALEQQAGELRRRIDAAEREAADVERQLAEREQRRRIRLDAIERCGVLATVAGEALRRAEASQALAASERDALEERRAEAQRELGALRAGTRELEAALAAVTEQRHREDLATQQLRHRLEAAEAQVAELDVTEVIAYAADPEQDQALAEDEDRLSRKLALLGAVNPLAVDEYQSLQERHTFLTAQLEDCRASKRDLLEVVSAVDERIRDVFAAAFADVAAQFERIFPLMFPGGEGRLYLTDTDDLLETGVEVEARPPGKRVKRLSLLSGGERSMCALAVLFAIFAARPSPFYVLDEVEAALDDVNLQRFLEVVRDFDSSQLLIVTHQKRTMEVADVLYGVTMRAGGVSTVVSQRLTELAQA